MFISSREIKPAQALGHPGAPFETGFQQKRLLLLELPQGFLPEWDTGDTAQEGQPQLCPAPHHGAGCSHSAACVQHISRGDGQGQSPPRFAETPRVAVAHQTILFSAALLPTRMRRHELSREEFLAPQTMRISQGSWHKQGPHPGWSQSWNEHKMGRGTEERIWQQTSEM